MSEMYLDDTVPVVDLTKLDGQYAATLDTSIGAGCHYYVFETGDTVTISGPETDIQGVIERVQIEHGVAVWVRPTAGGEDGE
jgi:hypothetical protein